MLFPPIIGYLEHISETVSGYRSPQVGTGFPPFYGSRIRTSVSFCRRTFASSCSRLFASFRSILRF